MHSETPRNHFDEDIERAEDVLSLASSGGPSIQDSQERDLRLAAIGMAVGAMDSYFCDAYVDALTAALKAFADGAWDELPTSYHQEDLPAGEVLELSRLQRQNWALRNAARKVMERDNMLKIRKVPGAFNPVLPDGQKLWNSVIDDLAEKGKKRLTGTTLGDLEGLEGSSLGHKRNEAANNMQDRIGSIVQIRNDWIHNCGRPKIAIEDYTQGEAALRVEQIKMVVKTTDDHLQDHRMV